MTGATDSALDRLGVDLAENASASKHRTGEVVDTQHGRAVYAFTVPPVFPGAVCIVGHSSAAASTSVIATLVSTGNVQSADGALAIAQTSIAASSFGWFYTEIRRSGVVSVAAGCNPNVPLYTTGTAGVVDDGVISTGRIQGLMTLVTAPGASTPAAVANNMVVVTQDIA